MSTWRQQFYWASTSSSTVQLSPDVPGGCVTAISRPASLAASQIVITTANATADAGFYGCGSRYVVTVERIT